MLVCLDANIVIYLVEKNAVWTAKAIARVAALRAAGDEMAICDASRVECLTKPLATADAAHEAGYRALFASAAVRMLPTTDAVWDRAASIGATFTLKPLDSVHLAAAVEHGCGLFLTNDVKLARCTAITVEILT